MLHFFFWRLPLDLYIYYKGLGLRSSLECFSCWSFTFVIGWMFIFSFEKPSTNEIRIKRKEFKYILFLELYIFYFLFMNDTSSNKTKSLTGPHPLIICYLNKSSFWVILESFWVILVSLLVILVSSWVFQSSFLVILRSDWVIMFHI